MHQRYAAVVRADELACQTTQFLQICMAIVPRDFPEAPMKMQLSFTIGVPSTGCYDHCRGTEDVFKRLTCRRRVLITLDRQNQPVGDVCRISAALGYESADGRAEDDLFVGVGGCCGKFVGSIHECALIACRHNPPKVPAPCLADIIAECAQADE